MREIKFRGMNPNGEWLYGDLIHRDGLSTIVPVDYYESVEDSFVMTSTVGQYIGLKDKNGKEIYEGDILNIYQYGHVVAEFAEGCYGAWDHYGFSPFRGTLFGCGGEVIGNIYEHPERIPEVHHDQ